MSKSTKKASGSKTPKRAAPKKATPMKKNTLSKKNSVNSAPIDLSILFKKLKDALRLSDDHVTGRDAVMAISQLVTLYLLEDNNKITHFGLPDWVNFSEIYKICQRDSEANKYKIRASDLLNKINRELRTNEHTSQAYQMKPPYTKYSTFRKLIVSIYEFFEAIDKDTRIKMKEKGDILGQEYEELLRTQLVGRDDGQYFTNRNAVKLIVDVVDPKLGETVYDPTCGTGGFLIYAFLHMQNQLKKKSGKAYEKLCKETLYGCDLDTKVMEILHSNLILHDIKHNDHFTNCNTIKDNQKRNLYDVVLSNYPFGKNGNKFFTGHAGMDKQLLKYYGHQSSTLPLLLLKHTINILTDGGRAGVIVTTGELTNSGADYTYFRKELVEENTLTKILILPKGLFENAKGVSTAVLCFTKGGRTDKVEFYDVPTTKCDAMNLIRTVTRAQIKKAGYSLDPQNFEVEEDIDYGDIPVMKLGDVCKIVYGTRITQKNNTQGDYPVYGGGGITFYTNDFNRKGKTLVVSRFGVSKTCVRIIDGKFWLNDSGMSLSAAKQIIQEYLN